MLLPAWKVIKNSAEWAAGAAVLPLSKAAGSGLWAQAWARLPNSPGSPPSALLERRWDELDRQQLLAAMWGVFGVKQTADPGRALAATAEPSCSCEQNLPWV